MPTAVTCSNQIHDSPSYNSDMSALEADQTEKDDMVSRGLRTYSNKINSSRP